jgi:hypothetical protein
MNTMIITSVNEVCDDRTTRTDEAANLDFCTVLQALCA